MAHALTCPQCSAPLTLALEQRRARCPYCGSTVELPAEPSSVSIGNDLIPDQSLAEVAMLMRAGKRVQATVRYREITGATLKEARAALDLFAAGEPLRRPNRMA